MSGGVLNSLVEFLDDPLSSSLFWGIKLDGHLVVEIILLAAIVFLLLQKSYQPEKKPLTKDEVDQLCEEWVPEPLHPPITQEMKVKFPVLESSGGPHTRVNGKDVLNLACANYLGLIGHPKIKEACEKALNRYGVGSCGPRGFYGTIDVHLELEKKLAQFIGTSDSILYSFGLATVSSVIPAFAKRGDLLIADEGIEWAIQNGTFLSRSVVRRFRHNDMKHLESILEEVLRDDKRKKKSLNRRYIVVEGIYQNSGEMVPLDELIRLKEKYKFRILLDESNTLGVLGKTGRGITEHFNVPVGKVDILTASMEHSLASIGGFCTGSNKVVDHQRLSGAGYCFSASLPPYLASGSVKAIELIEENPSIVSNLQKKIRAFRERKYCSPNLGLEAMDAQTIFATLRQCLSEIRELVLGGHECSPLIYLYLKDTTSPEADDEILQRIVNQMLESESILLTTSKRSFLDKCKLSHGIKICVSAAHSHDELITAADSLKRIVHSLM